MTLETDFIRIASILRASSPMTLDFPDIHALARKYIEIKFQGFPNTQKGHDYFEDALQLANEYDLAVSTFCASMIPSLLKFLISD